MRPNDMGEGAREQEVLECLRFLMAKETEVFLQWYPLLKDFIGRRAVPDYLPEDQLESFMDFGPPFQCEDWKLWLFNHLCL